jgi:hypothetical protein
MPAGFAKRHQEMREAKARRIEEERLKLNEQPPDREFCKKHYQPILETILHPDFTNSCIKCLREVFLKQQKPEDQDTLKIQMTKDI